MIAAVALEHTAAVTRMVGRAARRQRAQPERGEKVTPACPYDPRLIIGGERTVRQADREDLVGPDAGIIAVRAVVHVVQAFAVGAHEAREAALCGIRRGAEKVCLPQPL